jgi:hypothetical protein
MQTLVVVIAETLNSILNPLPGDRNTINGADAETIRLIETFIVPLKVEVGVTVNASVVAALGPMLYVVLAVVETVTSPEPPKENKQVLVVKEPAIRVTLTW